MILKLRQWSECIIISIIISIIIEMLIPGNKNKKYAKVVIGIYIMYVILNPILELLNYDFEIENIFENEISLEVSSSSYSDNYKDVYILAIEEIIKEKIENLGYEVEGVNVYVSSNYENIDQVEIQINDNENIIKIEEINIGKEKQIENEEIEKYIDIISFLEEEYFVTEEQIIFLN